MNKPAQKPTASDAHAPQLFVEALMKDLCKHLDDTGCFDALGAKRKTVVEVMEDLIVSHGETLLEQIMAQGCKYLPVVIKRTVAVDDSASITCKLLDVNDLYDVVNKKHHMFMIVQADTELFTRKRDSQLRLDV